MTAGFGFGKVSIAQTLFILGLLLFIVFAFDATFSGIKWLYFIAAGWLIVGTVGLWLPLKYSFLFGLASIPLELVPGLILTRIYRKECHGTS